MSQDKCIAFIGLHVLMALGLKNEIRKCGEVRVETFRSYQDFLPLAERMDAYAVSSGIFIRHLDFFLPRKMKTLVVDNIDEYDSGDIIPLSIGASTDEADVESIVGKLLSAISDKVDLPGELSAREKDVLRLIAGGKINKEIADELCISINTVKIGRAHV